MKFQFLILAKPTFNQLIHKVCTFIFQLGMSQMLYMCSSFWLLGVESLEFSQTEKETTACKAEEIHKIATIFTQNDNLILGIREFASSSFFLST